jgi:hypothetical protein
VVSDTLAVGVFVVVPVLVVAIAREVGMIVSGAVCVDMEATHS